MALMDFKVVLMCFQMVLMDFKQECAEVRNTSIIASHKSLVERVQVWDKEEPEESYWVRYWVQEQGRAGDVHGR